MKPIPDDPMAAHSRFIAALCDDFAKGDFATTPRAKAVIEIRRQTAALREQGLLGGPE